MISRLLSIAVGLLLVVSAILKLHSFLFSPFEPHLLLPYRWQHLSLIVFESLLATWLLCGQGLATARLFGLMYFSLAALASLYMGWIGQTSCGCFGKVSTNPWIAMVIDLTALTALLLIRTHRTEPTRTILRSTVFQVAIGTVVTLGLAIELFFLTVQHPDQLLAQWRGDIIAIEPAVLAAGSAIIGEKRPVTVRIHNYSDRNVEIVGGTASCSCLAIESLPVRIGTGGFKDIQVIISFKGSPGRFIRQFVLYTDHPSARVVYISFRGEVLASSDHPG